jgi:hypothetical protein
MRSAVFCLRLKSVMSARVHPAPSSAYDDVGEGGALARGGWRRKLGMFGIYTSSGDPE